jgi:hypothetical protein
MDPEIDEEAAALVGQGQYTVQRTPLISVTPVIPPISIPVDVMEAQAGHATVSPGFTENDAMTGCFVGIGADAVVYSATDGTNIAAGDGADRSFEHGEYLKAKERPGTADTAGDNNMGLSFSDRSSRWVHDSERDSCSDCRVLFDFWNRRHHCRRCGEVFCDSCSNQRSIVPLEEILSPPGSFSLLDEKLAHRVCNTCAGKPVAVAMNLPGGNFVASYGAHVVRDDSVDAGAAAVPYTLRLPPFSHTHQSILVWLSEESEIRFNLPETVKAGDEIVAMIPIFKIPAPKTNKFEVVTPILNQEPETPPKQVTKLCPCCQIENDGTAVICCKCESKLPSPLRKSSSSNVLGEFGKKLPETHVLELEFGVQTKKEIIRIPADYKEGDEVFFALLDNRMWTVMCPMNSVGGSKMVISFPDHAKISAAKAKAKAKKTSRRKPHALNKILSLASPSPTAVSSSTSTPGISSPDTVSKLGSLLSGFMTPKTVPSADGNHFDLIREFDVDMKQASVIDSSTSASLETPLTVAPKVVVSQDTFDPDGDSVRKRLILNMKYSSSLDPALESDEEDVDWHTSAHQHEEESKIDSAPAESASPLM